MFLRLMEFLNMFLKRYGYKFDLNPDFQIYNDYINEKLFDSLAEEFVFEKNFSLLQKIPYPVLKNFFLSYFKCRLKYGEVSFYNEKDFKEFNQQKELFDRSGGFRKGKEKVDILEIQKQFEKNKSSLVKLLNEDQSRKII